MADLPNPPELDCGSRGRRFKSRLSPLNRNEKGQAFEACPVFKKIFTLTPFYLVLAQSKLKEPIPNIAMVADCGTLLGEVAGYKSSSARAG